MGDEQIPLDKEEEEEEEEEGEEKEEEAVGDEDAHVQQRNKKKDGTPGVTNSQKHHNRIGEGTSMNLVVACSTGTAQDSTALRGIVWCMPSTATVSLQPLPRESRGGEAREAPRISPQDLSSQP